MKKALRFTGLGFLLVLLGLQFIRPPRNTGEAEGPQSIVATQEVPAAVKGILARACYDCHSNDTRYPWYAAVQPVAWWLDQHVVEGKAELNFSEFAAYDSKKAGRKLLAVADEVYDRHMPLESYLIMHAEAKLTDAEVTLLADWAEELADSL